MYPHRIRLRGPWECEPLPRAEGAVPVPAPPVMALPARWHEGGLPGFTGRVRFRRRFGYPGQIDSHERVWLTFAGVSDRADVWLNERALGQLTSEAPGSFEVTPLLQERNELVVEVEGQAESGGLWGEVALEVRCTAYLREVQVWVEPAGKAFHLHATGEVVGSADRPLDLYVLLGRSNLAYTTVEPLEPGQSFHLGANVEREQLQGEDGSPALAQVDLVNGAVVWYTWRGELSA
jgi:hypothetical protein